jgi:hypothetical protein
MFYRESSGDVKTISTIEISARKPEDVWPERSFKFRRNICFVGKFTNSHSIITAHTFKEMR